MSNEIIDLITHELATHYYRAETTNIDVAFEEALQATNTKIQEIIAHIGEEWLAHTAIIVGVRHEQHVIFSYVGSAIALMIHHENVADLIDTAHAKAQPLQALKVFTSTLAGELRRHATLFFATEHILDYLSREKIKRVIERHAPQEAMEELYHLLEEDTANTNFLALLVKLNYETKSPDLPNQISSSEQRSQQDSMAELVGKESRTEELLSASLWPSVKKWMSGRREHTPSTSTKKYKADEHERTIANRASDEDDILMHRHRDHALPARGQQRIHREQPSLLRSLLLLLGRGIVAGGRLMLRGMQIVWDFLHKIMRRRGRVGFSSFSSSVSMRRRIPHALPAALGNMFIRIGRWFASLTRIQKLFFIVGIVVLLIFAQTVVNRGEKQLRSEEEQQYGALLSDIEKKVNEGKAALLYDSARARELFLEARGMLEQIPPESSLFRERGSAVQQTLQEQFKLVNNVVMVNEPKVLLNYATINPAIRLRRMILLGASVYAFDENNTSVYRGNLENQGTTVTISDATSATGTFQAVAKASPGTGIVIFSNENIALFNPVSETFTDLDLGYGNQDRNLVDIAVYGVRLYTIDTVQNQIMRHQRDGERFGEGTPWITEGTPSLTDAVGMAIDGNIYILKASGEVNKFTTGRQNTDFRCETIDPMLSSAEKIATDENTQNIYILDRTRQRVVVFTKDGKLVQQYTSSAFTDLRDMIVDEPNKRILLLNGTQVMQIDLP